MLFPEATASCDKKFWNNFLLHCTFICMSSKSVNFFFQTGDINIFALLAIFFSKYVQLKSSFCQKKKHQWRNLRHSLDSETSITGRCWNSSKFVIMQNYTDNANGNVLLTVEYSPSHTCLIILIRFITLTNNWMNPCVKTEGQCNESVNNEFKIMKESNSLHQIMRVSK